MRSIRMRAETERSIDLSVPEADLLAVVVCAHDIGSQDRIVRALTEQELPIRDQVDDPAEAAVLELDATTIVVLVCDVDKPREMAALRRLRRDAPDPAIVVISPPATGTGVRRVLDAGADALVFDPELERTLPTTVRAVSIGQSAIPRKFLASVEKPILSHRENEVLALVRSGLTNAEIAERLFLAESTVKSHLSSIFTKFGVRSRKEVAAAFADGDSALGEAVAFATNGEPPERATA
jgi:DNA-binding NarL/FixJ family response regulator